MTRKQDSSTHNKVNKCYIYTRVSTKMQVDGYSLEAQENRCRAMAEAKGYEVVRIYHDDGKSGKTTEGRDDFNRMLKDIEMHKDGVSLVFVFKLSRFGRNTRDVLNSFQILKENGCELVCVEDSIDTTNAMGEVILKILAAIAEMERHNISVQTMAGRIQKAEDGKWNGGFAPYGYTLVDGKLQIAEDEAEVIRIIFDRFVHTTMGYVGVANYLLEKGVQKKIRQNGKLDTFTQDFVKNALDNEVYMGKIHFGKRKNQVEQKEYGVYQGIHEPIVSEELWELAHKKRMETVKRLEKVYDKEHEFQLSGLIKCPLCGRGMVGNINRKKKSDGSLYKTYYSYYCNNRKAKTGYRCEYHKQPGEAVINEAVKEIVVSLVSNPKFTERMKEKVKSKVDTSEVDTDIKRLEQNLKSLEIKKNRLISEIDNLEINETYEEREQDLNERLNDFYVRIADTKKYIQKKKEEKVKIEQDKITGDTIYKNLMAFVKVLDKTTDGDKKRLYNILIKEIQIFEEKQEDGRWIKSITFNFPVYYKGNMVEDISWVTDSTNETVCLLSKLSEAKHHIEVKVDMDELDLTSAEAKATYREIEESILKKISKR